VWEVVKPIYRLATYATVSIVAIKIKFNTSNLTTASSDYSFRDYYAASHARGAHVHCVSEKTIHLTFDHNFGKYKPILKILSLTDSCPRKFSMNCHRVFQLTLTVLLHYLVKCKKSN